MIRSKRRQKVFGFFASSAFILSVLTGGQALTFASAQEAPSSPSSPSGIPGSADVGGGPPPGVQQGPTDAEIAAFENEAGAPVEAFNQARIERPTFEEPGKVSDDVKKLVPQQEIVDVYCAMTKWKSGSFFSAMDSLKKNLLPAIDQARALGMDMDVPDIDGMKAEGTKRISAICAAKTLDEAERLVQDFIDWGKSQADAQMNQSRGSSQAQIKTQSDEIRAKVKEQLQPFIDAETAKIKPEIDAKAREIASDVAAKYQGGQSAPDMSAVQGEVMSRLQPLIDQKKTEIQAKIQAKAKEIVKPLTAKFEGLLKVFEGMDAKINADIKSGEAKYAAFKTKALGLRKDLIVKILDANVKMASDALMAQSGQIEKARKADPSLASVADMNAELARDVSALKAKLDKALSSEDENALQSGIDEFRKKWEAVQRNAERASASGVAQICAQAVPQFDAAILQIDAALPQIMSVQSQCTADPSASGCDNVRGLSDRLNSASTKLSDLKREMVLVKDLCASNADHARVLALVQKIEEDGKDAQAYGDALQAEKQNMTANSVKAVCDEALPQLDAGRIELGKNDLVVLRSNVDRCAGKTTTECTDINALKPRFDALNAKVSSFSSALDQAQAACRKLSNESDPNKIVILLSDLQRQGDALRDEAKDLKAQQAEQGSAKAYCRAVLESLSSSEVVLQKGMDTAKGTLSACVGKTDARCAYVNTKMTTKIGTVQTKSLEELARIGSIKTQCASAGMDPPGSQLLALVDGLKTDADALQRMVADLMAEADLAATKSVASVWIEAEKESRTKLLPHAESWHSHKWAGEASWRPPLFGPGYWYLSRGGEYLEYDISVPADGTYNAWIRDYVDNFQARGIRRINIMYDGKSYGTFGEADIPVKSEKGAVGWHKVGSGVTLKAGAHVMRVTKEATTAGAAVLDAYYLTTGNDVPSEK